jgi:hypothetical protein
MTPEEIEDLAFKDLDAALKKVNAILFGPNGRKKAEPNTYTLEAPISLWDKETGERLA